jgi:hypothetical protein
MSQNNQQSQFVIPIREKQVPFYIREWETLLLGTLIVCTLMYLLCSCGSENFNSGKYVFDRRGSVQAHFGIDDRPGHRPRVDNFRILPVQSDRRSDVQYELFGTKGAVLTGKRHPSSGPSVSRFMDFDAVDKIDQLNQAEPNPVHQPSTPDGSLEQLLRSD